MKHQPIAIICHWHTGSTCLAEIISRCGMHLGDETTEWRGRRPGQEHPTLSTVGNSIYHKLSAPEPLLDDLRRVLKKYKEQAEIKGWGHYGFSNNHFQERTVWQLVYPILKELWPDAKYIVSIRHPLDIVKSTNDPAWDTSKIISSWLDSLSATEEMINSGAELVVFPDSYDNVVFPDSYDNGHIRRVVANLGLTWTEEAGKVYDRSRIKNISTPEEQERFARKCPGATAGFERLKKLGGKA